MQNKWNPLQCQHKTVYKKPIRVTDRWLQGSSDQPEVHLTFMAAEIKYFYFFIFFGTHVKAETSRTLASYISSELQQSDIEV